MNFRHGIFRAAAGFLFFAASFALAANAQTVPSVAPDIALPKPTPTPALSPIPEPPAVLPPLSREQRQQSYTKLLEGQRYMWNIRNQRIPAASGASARMARQALQKAVELNPGLAEGYTALAELTLMTRGSIAETERLAGISARLDKNNFGARQILAWVYTVQSGLGRGEVDKNLAGKAIGEWREIARLDPRNAEAWAFLSDLYEQTGQTEQQIESLKKWSGAIVNPLNPSPFVSLTSRESFAPENAAPQLGRALLKSGKYSEAVTALIQVLADDPSEDSAPAALEEALEKAGPADSARAIEVLRQAVNSNPGNPALLEILINAQIRAGRTDEAVQLLKATGARLAASDKTNAALLQARLGALYSETGRDREAAAAFEDSLKTLNIGTLELQTEIERDFAARIVPQLVAAYKNSNQNDKAKEAIQRLRLLLGTNDLTADLQMIDFLRIAGEHQTALETARSARQKFPADINLLRIEAEILTDAGKVEEGVTLLRSEIVNKAKPISVPASARQDFILNLYVSNLYRQAGRGLESIAAARAALDLATDSQMSNVALGALATAQNAAGEFKSAETTLRDILKTDPANATALNNLGYFMVERGERMPEALELIKRAVELQPNNASFLDSLGWAHFKMGQFAEAERYLTDAARKNPASFAIHNHLGDLYQKQGNPEKARAAWRKALKLTAKSSEIEQIKNKLGEKKR